MDDFVSDGEETANLRIITINPLARKAPLSGRTYSLQRNRGYWSPMCSYIIICTSRSNIIAFISIYFISIVTTIRLAVFDEITFPPLGHDEQTWIETVPRGFPPA